MAYVFMLVIIRSDDEYIMSVDYKQQERRASSSGIRLMAKPSRVKTA